METTQHITIDALNSLLKDELAAIQTYDVALHDRSAFSGKTELSQCQRSHEARAVILREKIVSLGGEPASGPGVAGAWSKLVERGAVAISEDMAIAALEQGEDRVLHDYRAKLADVPPDVRVFLESKILPEEELTHRTLSDLKHRIQSAS
jgi:bacterioferritin (cytochrome b1)